MPSYKLTYFNLRARAEVARLLFAAAGVEYEDKRVQGLGEEWKALKPKTPFGSLPLLEVDGVVLCQSNTIARFLAERFGFMGSNDLENAQINIVVDCVNDILLAHSKLIYMKDQTQKATETQKFQDEILPIHLTNLQKMLNANEGGSGFFVGAKVSVADISVYHCIDTLEKLGTVIEWDKFSNLQGLTKRVASIPKIRTWLDNRPDNPF